MTQQAKKAAAYIQQKAPNITPQLAVILGSGLGDFVSHIEDAIVFPYQDLPGFPECTVAGHGGHLYLGTIHGTPIACLQGRVHLYEGVDNSATQTMIRTLKLLGTEALLATNAAGSLNVDVTPGNLVMINDHINLQFNNPLCGPNDDEFGPRFLGMEDIYNPALRQALAKAAESEDITLHEGVYIGTLGPTFETPAEIRAFKTLGADVVGMSTIPDIVTAHHCGMKTAAISVVTNLAAGLSKEPLSHEVTLRGAKLGAEKMQQLTLRFIQSFSEVAAECK